MNLTRDRHSECVQNPHGSAAAQRAPRFRNGQRACADVFHEDRGTAKSTRGAARGRRVVTRRTARSHRPRRGRPPLTPGGGNRGGDAGTLVPRSRGWIVRPRWGTAGRPPPRTHPKSEGGDSERHLRARVHGGLIHSGNPRVHRRASGRSGGTSTAQGVKSTIP